MIMRKKNEAWSQYVQLATLPHGATYIAAQTRE